MVPFYLTRPPYTREERKIYLDFARACGVPSKPAIHCAIASRASEEVHNLSRCIHIL